MPPSTPGDALCFLNGRFLPSRDAYVSVDDRGWLFADGCYEVARAEAGHLVWEAEHWQRLRSGLAALGIAGDCVASLPAIARRLLRANELDAAGVVATVYVQVSRGAVPQTRAHAFPPASTPPTVYVCTRRAAPAPPGGVAAIAVPDERWARCDIKTVSLLPNVLAKQKAAAANAYEALLLRGGAIVEASHSNVFAVIGGELWTAPLENVLPGITRAVILARAPALGLRVVERAIPLDRWADMSELMVTSTGPDIAAVTSVDGRTVGDGAVGPVAQRLLAAFRGAWAREDRETAAARLAAAGLAIDAAILESTE